MSQTQELSPSDSLERDENDTKDDKKTKTRRPPNTAFRQQRLKAWQPILTPKTVLPLLFVVGLIFAPIGGLLLYASAQVQEISIDYTQCEQAPTSFQDMDASRISTSFGASTSSTSSSPKWKQETIKLAQSTTNTTYKINTTKCSLLFNIPDNMGPPVLLYYRLTNFYQNHRRYVKSFDQDQLSGTAVSNSSVSGSACDPLTNDENGFAYYPCGLIANSIFNDTFNSPVLLDASNGSNATNITYQMTNQGIAWSSDANLYGNTQYTNDQVVPPPNWKERYPDGYNADFPIPQIHEDEAFQVWMRTAGLPTFSKLALRNDSTAMGSGTYQLDIYDYFPAHLYGGTKSILISTRTVMGGKNPFLGIAYIVVGGICVVLGALFLATHLIKPRKLGDHKYLSWNNDQPSTATTTGRSPRPNESA